MNEKMETERREVERPEVQYQRLVDWFRFDTFPTETSSDMLYSFYKVWYLERFKKKPLTYDSFMMIYPYLS